jgi:hypothetical protein
MLVALGLLAVVPGRECGTIMLERSLEHGVQEVKNIVFNRQGT